MILAPKYRGNAWISRENIHGIPMSNHLPTVWWFIPKPTAGVGALLLWTTELQLFVRPWKYQAFKVSKQWVWSQTVISILKVDKLLVTFMSLLYALFYFHLFCLACSLKHRPWGHSFPSAGKQTIQWERYNVRTYSTYTLVIQHSYWTWPFIVSLSMKNGDFS